MARLGVSMGFNSRAAERRLASVEARMKKLGKTSDDTKRKFQGVAGPATGAGNGLIKLGKGAAVANTTVVEFSRTLQDAPYGIQGMANNLQQLAANFANLQAVSQKTGTSVKTLLTQALTGPTGLVVGITAITLAIQVLIPWFKSLNKNIDETKQRSDALKKFVESLDAVNTAQLEGARGSAAQLQQLNQLRTFIEDNTQALDDRKRAIDDLNRAFPGYFEKLNQEKILNGEIEDTYRTLTNEIIRRAKATAASEELVKLAKEQFALEKKRDDSRKKSADLQVQKTNKLAALNKTLTAGDQARTDASTKIAFDTQEIADINSDITTEQSEQKQLTEDINKNLAEQARLARIAQENFDPNRRAPGKPPKPKLDPLSDEAIADFELDSDLEEAIANNIFITKEYEKTMAQSLPEILFGNAALRADIKSTAKQFHDSAKEAGDGVSEWERLMERFQQNLLRIEASSLTSSIQDVFSSLTDALVSGTNAFAALGGALLRSFGRFLSRMGAALISYGYLAKQKGILDIAVAIGGPTAIAAGVAAIKTGALLTAAGAVFGAIASAGFSGAGGGSSGSSTASTGGSNIANTGGIQTFSGDGTVVFRIAGQDLVGVLSRNLAKNQRLGGSLSLG